jgi:RND family efflux transporter MFP subunit
MKITKHILSALILISVILAAVLLVRHRHAELNAMSTPAKMPIPVEVAVVSSGTLQVREHYLGRVQPINSEILSSKVAGYLMAVKGYPGDKVNSGEVLIRIDDRVFTKKVAAVSADMEGAKKEFLVRQKVFQRYSKMLKQNAASQQQYDLYQMDRDLNKAKIERLQEELENAKIELGYATITAPFSGIILKRFHEPGELIQTGEPILEIEVPDEGYKVVLQVPQAVIKHVTPGATAYLIKDGAKIEAKVTRIFPMVFSPETLITMEIDIPRRPFGLQSGATIDVDLVVAAPQGFEVPLRALLQNHDKNYVFKVIDGDRVKTVPVTMLGWTEKTASISGDLSVGDKVITADEAALLRLGEGTKVLVTKEFLP